MVCQLDPGRQHEDRSADEEIADLQRVLCFSKIDTSFRGLSLFPHRVTHQVPEVLESE
jgi:hypothetical protein